MMKDNRLIDRFVGREATLAVVIQSDWQTNREILATDDSRLGKGVSGAIPLHLILTANDLQLKKNRPTSWEITQELIQ